MSNELRLAGYREPLGLWIRQGPRSAARPELRTQELEFSSRGDRVTGRVILPVNVADPIPLVLVQHGLGGSAAEALAVGASWVEAGTAVAAIDFPLHGGRADQKLLRWLRDGRGSDPRRTALARELTRQAVIDLERALDALSAAEWIDVERIGYVGFGWGGRVGSAFCALDPRPAAAALALGPAEHALSEPDPAHYLARIAPRALLLVGARAERSSARPAFERVDGAEQVWLDTDSEQLPNAAAGAIGSFLGRTLGL